MNAAEYHGRLNPCAFVRTYGCQQNVADSEKIKGILLNMGYNLTDDESTADLILFNTCAVREHAEDRVFGNVGALKSRKKKNPKLIVAVCGCMPEEEHVVERLKKTFPFVDLVFGTRSFSHLESLLKRLYLEKRRVFEYGVEEKVVAEGLPIHRDGDLKAYLSIMYGCDNFCSYCIVPYTRGRERSRKYADVIKEAHSIVEGGYKEITLLGQNVNSYGKGLHEGISFPKLLNDIANINGDFWVRFMTSHPKDATRELIDVMAKNDKICNHIHLPFQSGSNRILSRMNRKYTREDYVEIVRYARCKIPNVSITSDIIVGFPGETYEDFCETLSLVKEIGFTALFTFIYSRRTGTKAASFPDPVPYSEKNKWFQQLLEVQKEKTSEYCESVQGEIMRVLVEKSADANGHLTARNEGNVVVDVEGDKDLIGKFVNVRIVGYKNWVLKGEVIN